MRARHDDYRVTLLIVAISVALGAGCSEHEPEPCRSDATNPCPEHCFTLDGSRLLERGCLSHAQAGCLPYTPAGPPAEICRVRVHDQAAFVFPINLHLIDTGLWERCPTDVEAEVERAPLCEGEEP